MKVKHFKILILLLISGQLFPQNQNKINDLVSSKFNKGVFTSANISLSVIACENGNEIINHRSKKNLVPASSLKLFTTLTSLKTLKPSYTFITSLGYRGKISPDGTLIGDLIIKGSGDPTLGSDRIKGTSSFDDVLLQFSKAVLDAGINCIEGKIIVDESIFDSYPVAPSWQWNDLGNYYATGAWGVNINENLYYLAFNNKGSIGSIPKLKSINPKVLDLSFSNELAIDSSHTGDQAYIFGGPYNFRKRIVGTIPQGNGHFTIKGSIPNPPLFFGQKLKEYLAELNIQVLDVNVNFSPKKYITEPLSTVESPHLKDIVRRANFDSHNLYAEALLKIMGYHERGQGSGQNGIAVIKNQLSKYGIDNSEFILYDGSGLSARNNISSHAMAKFLYKFSQDVKIENAIKFIPRGSYEGTVRSMFKSSISKGNIWLKSGSMEGVQSYSGYIQSKDKKWYAFSFIVNGFSTKGRSMRYQMEKILDDIYLAL